MERSSLVRWFAFMWQLMSRNSPYLVMQRRFSAARETFGNSAWNYASIFESSLKRNSYILSAAALLADLASLSKSGRPPPTLVWAIMTAWNVFLSSSWSGANILTKAIEFSTRLVTIKVSLLKVLNSSRVSAGWSVMERESSLDLLSRSLDSPFFAFFSAGGSRLV